MYGSSSFGAGIPGVFPPPIVPQGADGSNIGPQPFIQPVIPVTYTDPTVAAVRNLTASEAASLGGMMAAGPAAAANEEKKKKPHLRKAAGETWNDPTLGDWPENDHRVFCGDLGNEVTDEMLGNAFKKYPSFLKAKVIRDKRCGKTKGYGFVSFHNAEDMLLALKDMNKKYVGNRPIRVMKSKWKDREIDSEKNRELGDLLKTVSDNSKKLRKFKKIGVPVTGGKKGVYSPPPRSTGPRGRGYYGPGGTGRLTHLQQNGLMPAPAKRPGASTASAHFLADI